MPISSQEVQLFDRLKYLLAVVQWPSGSLHPSHQITGNTAKVNPVSGSQENVVDVPSGHLVPCSLATFTIAFVKGAKFLFHPSTFCKVWWAREEVDESLGNDFEATGSGRRV